MPQKISKTELQRFHKEVEKTIRQLPSFTALPAYRGENYVGAGKSRLNFLDIKIPVLRERFKQGWSFADLSADEQFQIYHHIFLNSQTHDVMTVPLIWLEKQPAIVRQYRKRLLDWNTAIDNWALADGYSRFLSELLEEHPKEMIPVIKKWTLSKKPWQRRLAVVSLFFYDRFRQKPPPKALVKWVFEKLAYDEEYYVKRGLGWALRECFSFYPDISEQFLKKHATHLASITWTTGLERVSTSERKKYNRFR